MARQALQIQIGAKHRRCDPQVEQSIGDRRPADDQDLQRAQHEDDAGKRGIARSGSSQEKEKCKRPCCRTDCRRQAHGKGAQTKQMRRGRLQPVDQDWLYRSIFAIQVGGQVIAACDHLAGRFGERPFVPIKERLGAQTIEQCEKSECKQQALRAAQKPNGRRIARRVAGFGFVLLAHLCPAWAPFAKGADQFFAVSLALNYYYSEGPVDSVMDYPEAKRLCPYRGLCFAWCSAWA